MLKPDDLGEAELVGVWAGEFGGVHDESQVRPCHGEDIAVQGDGTYLWMVDRLGVRAGGIDLPLRPQRGESPTGPS